MLTDGARVGRTTRTGALSAAAPPKRASIGTLAKLQIDGVPEQLAEWEEAQKKKRLEDARDGKNKQAGAAAAAKSSQWEVVKKDAQRGTVAGAAVAALTGGEAK